MDISWIDEETIMTASTDGTLNIWNAKEGIPVK
jgi:hypothetical protein